MPATKRNGWGLSRNGSPASRFVCGRHGPSLSCDIQESRKRRWAMAATVNMGTRKCRYCGNPALYKIEHRTGTGTEKYGTCGACKPSPCAGAERLVARSTFLKVGWFRIFCMNHLGGM